MMIRVARSSVVVSFVVVLGLAVGCAPAKSTTKKSAPAPKTAAAKKSEPEKKAAPAAKEEPAKTSAPASSAALKAEVKIGTDIQDREPTGVSNSFDSGTLQVVGWTRVTGANEPTEIIHVWSYKGAEQSSVPLPVKSSSYRTFSRKSVIGQKGKWKLTVKDAEGRVIGSKDFEIK